LQSGGIHAAIIAAEQSSGAQRGNGGLAFGGADLSASLAPVKRVASAGSHA